MVWVGIPCPAIPPLKITVNVTASPLFGIITEKIVARAVAGGVIWVVATRGVGGWAAAFVVSVVVFSVFFEQPKTPRATIIKSTGIKLFFMVEFSKKMKRTATGQASHQITHALQMQIYDKKTAHASKA